VLLYAFGAEQQANQHEPPYTVVCAVAPGAGACTGNLPILLPARCPAVLLQVYRCVTNVASDFYTGVQAALIHRTGSPAWVPASLKDVSAAMALHACSLHRHPSPG
jgi:hypothetical protein